MANIKTKEVLAARLQVGQLVAIGGREGFYLIQKIERRGDFMVVEVQGSFYPVCFPVSQWLRVKL